MSYHVWKLRAHCMPFDLLESLQWITGLTAAATEPTSCRLLANQDTAHMAAAP